MTVPLASARATTGSGPLTFPEGFLWGAATASFQIVPFLRRYRLLAAREPVSLDDALAHYLLV